MAFKASAPRSVLLVCLGNICRSPTAEEILRQKAAVAGMSLTVDSAGTGDWHIGKHPDERAQKHAKSHGYAIDKLQARQVSKQDFFDFDLILAMDEQNLEDLQAIKNSLVAQGIPDTQDLARLALFSEEDPRFNGQNVPDPYYGEEDGFKEVIVRLESSADAWIESWKC